ncbi:MAG TPA: methyltransferase domain-containing protein [Chloroflexia bacterium]|nr:methyltransferase domain-containing protein [Chloroflexia bacterium]
MRIFRTPPYRNVPELLDSLDDVSEKDLTTTLRDIRRANIFGLGTWVIKHHLADLLRDVPPNRPLRVLDLATGSADIPEELCRWAARVGRDISFVATDISPEILAVARRRVTKAGFGHKVSFLACDASEVPFSDNSFDVVICSLALHHLSLGDARHALREMSRAARVGFIVNDVYRSQGAWYMAWLLTHLTTNNRLTRHDGPASVLRAFSPAEMRRMAAELGIATSVQKHAFWRAALVGRTGT